MKPDEANDIVPLPPWLLGMCLSFNCWLWMWHSIFIQLHTCLSLHRFQLSLCPLHYTLKKKVTSGIESASNIPYSFDLLDTCSWQIVCEACQHQNSTSVSNLRSPKCLSLIRNRHLSLYEIIDREIKNCDHSVVYYCSLTIQCMLWLNLSKIDHRTMSNRLVLLVLYACREFVVNLDNFSLRHKICTSITNN